MSVVTFRDFSIALQALGIPRHSPVIVHASLSAFGQVRGGAETVVGALLATYHRVMAPTFTYQTMVIPETGPLDNGIHYGSGKDTNRMAKFFHPDMPADKMMGAVAEKLRNHPKARRSSHPILSFAGVNVDQALDAQSLANPLAPIQQLHEHDGWILLVGVDHSANTSIHYAEKLAARKQFTRWALTRTGVCECPGFPGDSHFFNTLEPAFQGVLHTTQVGYGVIRAIPLNALVEKVVVLIQQDRTALLCDRFDCERCLTVRLQIE